MRLGTCRISFKISLRFWTEGDLKTEEPIVLMDKPWPFDMVNWSGPSNGDVCWILREKSGL